MAEGRFGATETAVLEAVLDRLCPTDETGPGARDAGVDAYVLGGLSGQLAPFEQFLVEGFAALESAATRLHGRRFAGLEMNEQDALLGQLERGTLEEIPDGGGFFNLVHHLMLEGMFGDPRHGGNRDHAGWRLLGFPGLRLEVSADEQALGTVPTGPIRSIVDYPELPHG